MVGGSGGAGFVRQGFFLRAGSVAMSLARVSVAAVLCGCAAAVVPVLPSIPEEALADPGVHQVWHAEDLDGRVLASSEAERPVNPASVVKLVTTLWALDKLGAEYRFLTKFRASGPVKDGELQGDLLIEGAGDPDFHAENVFLVARELNLMGIRSVRGRIVVTDGFWMGWEGGSARRERNAERRALQMATRFRQALDRERWDGDLRKSWDNFAERRGFPVDSPPGVRVSGGFGRAALGDVSAGTLLLSHRSQPLLEALKRFNVFSNNDIERLEYRLGSPSEMASYLVRQHGIGEPGKLRFSTTSGLGQNRMTSREIVAAIRALRILMARDGRHLGDVMPTLGCGVSTLTKLFRSLAAKGDANGLVGKTGTLTTTDSGVSVLSGLMPTARGDVLFSVIAPRSGKALWPARQAAERWVRRSLEHWGTAVPRPCAEPFAHSDALAAIVR